MSKEETQLEKQLEKEILSELVIVSPFGTMKVGNPQAIKAILKIAKSEVAKQFHTQNMISEEDAINFAKFARFDVNSNHKDLKWKELLNNFLNH